MPEIEIGSHRRPDGSTGSHYKLKLYPSMPPVRCYWDGEYHLVAEKDVIKCSTHKPTVERLTALMKQMMSELEQM